MKLNRIIKILGTVLILLLVFFNNTNANMSSEKELKVASLPIDTSGLQDIYGPQDATYNKIGGRIIGVATYLCFAAAVIILIIKGIQFMNKSPEGKAEAKKELISYAIGALILFGIGGIIQIIGNIALNSLF